MRKSPFDISTSHHPNQEIVKGITSELGAKNLAVYTLAEWYETVFLMGMVALFILNKNLWSILAAVIVVFLVYFLEILIDNSSARMKSDLMIKLSWGVTLALAGTNFLVLIYMFN
jgi:ech hydrogenase subunit B